MRIRYSLATVLILAALILPELFLPANTALVGKLAFLAIMAIICRIMKPWRDIWQLAAVLLVINASFWLDTQIRNADWWRILFRNAGYFADVASSVAVKVIGIMPVMAILLLLLNKPARGFLAPGNLSAKAKAIVWLGIPEDRFRWGWLAAVSGILIMLGTTLLALITITGFRVPTGMDRWLSNLPLIMGLALVNSFCEGLVFRSAIMGPIRDVFPKFFVTLMPALFFGIAHYQGIPGGWLGAAMSGLLGWYMSRSVYEPNGFATGWIIHFWQDLAIFTTLALLG